MSKVLLERLIKNGGLVGVKKCGNYNLQKMSFDTVVNKAMKQPFIGFRRCHGINQRYFSSYRIKPVGFEYGIQTATMMKLLVGAGIVVAMAGATSYSHFEGSQNPQKESNVAVNVPDDDEEDESMKNTKIFCGNANPKLAEDIAKELGVKLGRASVEKFEDGEVNLLIHDTVRGKDVYIIQPTCTPVNENLMELFLMVSTLRRASARRITAVIPYYGYARQDRKMTARVPISAADVARLLEAMGVDRVVAVDLHCGQIQGFFGPRVPVDNLDGGQVGAAYFGTVKRHELKNPVIVSPDAGGVYRAKKFLERLQKSYGIEAGLAMIIKQRSKPGEVAKMDLVGNVQGCEAIIVDDMIDTAGTLCKAAEALKAQGATKVYAFASHGLFSPPAAERIAASTLDEVCVTNTIPTKPGIERLEKVKVLSVAKLIADAIRRIQTKKSISALFEESWQGKDVKVKNHEASN